MVLITEMFPGEPAIRWRFDRKCGSRHPLPDGTPSECDPDSETPCCEQISFSCLASNTRLSCLCTECVDYRAVKQIRKSGETCAVVNIEGFLKNACFDDHKKHVDYRCAYSDVRYTISHLRTKRFVSAACGSDPFAY